MWENAVLACVQTACLTWRRKSARMSITVVQQILDELPWWVAFVKSQNFFLVQHHMSRILCLKSSETDWVSSWIPLGTSTSVHTSFQLDTSRYLNVSPLEFPAGYLLVPQHQSTWVSSWIPLGTSTSVHMNFQLDTSRYLNTSPHDFPAGDPSVPQRQSTWVSSWIPLGASTSVHMSFQLDTSRYLNVSPHDFPAGYLSVPQH